MNRRLRLLSRLAMTVILLIVVMQVRPTSITAQTTTSFASIPPAFLSRLPPNNANLSQAYGLWQPTQFDTCPQWLHDTYWVYGPDGKVYPTWHPPTDIDPTTNKPCT